MSLCPICGAAGFHFRTLKSEFIKNQLHVYYNDPPPENLIINDYEMMRCSKCNLEYSIPQISGDDSFYQWIGSHNKYYPDERWEWDIVLTKLRELKYNGAKLLEIGCGSGNFLEKVAQIDNIEGYGLDKSITAIEKCKCKKLNVFFGTIESLLQENGLSDNKFEVIVAFHCLEHVDNPKKFLKDIIELLNVNGSIFISIPYSPMSFEILWFDPLNYPPHHMTRWNKKSLEELARQLDMQINIIMPNASPAFYRAIIAITFSINGPLKPISKWNTLINCLQNPYQTIRGFYQQVKREKINNKTAADVVLIELFNK